MGGLLLSLLGVGQGLRALPLVDARIDSLRVGRIVLAGQPTGEQDAEFGLHVDPPTWRKLVLRAPKQDGSLADVELLRPLAWLEAQLDDEAAGDEDAPPAPRSADPLEVRLTGRTIHVSVPECGIDGDARVLAVEPCPAIPGTTWWDRLLGRTLPPGARVVTGTFRHHGAQVLDLVVEGLDAPIGTTANHPFWSEDRQEFVRADQLEPGERLRTLRSDRTPSPLSDTPAAPRGPPTSDHAAAFPRVVSITPRPGTHTVHNLEVHLDHVYHVAKSGVLVHNAVPSDGCFEGVGYRVMSQNELEGAAQGKWRDSDTVRTTVGEMGSKWLWKNRKAAERWLEKLEANGERGGIITRVPTRRPILSYDVYRHPPEGTAIHVPIPDLGVAVPLR